MLFLSFLAGANAGELFGGRKQLDIGVVVDMGSWTGKNVHACISMAVSDFYASHDHYRTRLVLHTRDSGGDPTRAISSALDLLEKAKVQTLIIGPENDNLETKSLGAFANKAKVPVFSFTSTLSSSVKYPFLVHINQDETLQFKAIASILGLYQWKTVTLIFEDTEDGRDSIPYLIRSLHEKNVHVTHRTPISPHSTDDQILDELVISRQTVFIVHLSPSSAYRVLSTAKKLGMMEEGYAWIVTDKTMNQLQTMDEEMYQVMQGVVGLKSYIPFSKNLQDFMLRWEKEFYSKDSFVKSRDPDVLCIWAYDTIWALAESIEKLGHKYYIGADEMAGGNFFGGEELVYGIARTRFTGLSGEFQMVGGRILSEAFEVVNVIGKSERSLSLWSSEHGVVKGRSLLVSGSNPKNKRAGLDEAIIWPGFTKVAPKGRLMLAADKKLRIAVVNNDGFGHFIRVKRDIQANTTSVTGFCPDVFRAALELLGYEVDFDFIPYVDQDGKNLGSYADLVKQVYLQKYDGIVGDISITVNRSLYVDFTVTYSDVGLGTIMKRDSSDDVWLFSRPFQGLLWLTLTIFLFITGCVVSFIEHSEENKKFIDGSVLHRIGTALWFGCSTLFYAHREPLKSNWSRLIVIVWLFSVFILQSSYTATLSSMLTLQQIKLGSAGHYIGTHSNSFLGETIVTNLNYKDDRLKLYKTCEEYADALSKGNKGGVGAIIDEIPYLKVFLAKYGNEYAMVASHSVTNGLGFAFQKKHAVLVADLSGAIVKLREDEKLAAMEDFWIKSAGQPLLPKTDAPDALSPYTFGALFLASFLCFISAILFQFGNKVLPDKLRNFFNATSPPTDVSIDAGPPTATPSPHIQVFRRALSL